MRNPILLAFAAAFLVLPLALSGQTATITAQATVIPPLSITGARPLDFGEVIPGFARSVAVDAAASGQWQITGTGIYEVSMDFTLPTTLSDPASNTLPISFASGDAGHAPDNTGTAVTPIDPNATGLVANLSAGSLWVHIGGTVTPGAGQPAGVYTAPVTLDIAYTGN
jgi:hypothetical protein